MAKFDYDLIVVGAGVAGLAAATASSRAGASTLVVDAAPEIAAKVKGEVIRQKNTIIQKILGKPLPETIVDGATRRRRIFSPSCKKDFVVTRNEASLVIEYRLLLQDIARACVSSGASIHLNTEVACALVDDDEQVVGLQLRQPGGRFDVRAKVIIAADGWNSLLRRQMNLPPPIICPAYKVIVEGADIAEPDLLEFHLLNEPAGVLWIFPKGSSTAESGITYWDHTPETQQLDLQATWQRYREEHPVFKRRLKNASPLLTSKDGLVFGGVLQDFSRPGLILVGDAAGHVGASGGSGILSGLSMGYGAGEFLGAYAASHQSPPDNSIMQRCTEVMKSTQTWQMLQSEEKSGAMTRHFLFKILKTNEEIDAAWETIAEMASSQ